MFYLLTHKSATLHTKAPLKAVHIRSTQPGNCQDPHTSSIHQKSMDTSTSPDRSLQP